MLAPGTAQEKVQTITPVRARKKKELVIIRLRSCKCWWLTHVNQQDSSSGGEDIDWSIVHDVTSPNLVAIVGNYVQVQERDDLPGQHPLATSVHRTTSFSLHEGDLRFSHSMGSGSAALLGRQSQKPEPHERNQVQGAGYLCWVLIAGDLDKMAYCCCKHHHHRSYRKDELLVSDPDWISC